MKTLIISGAGSGIGRGIAMALDDAAESFGLVLLGRNEARLRETLGLLKNRSAHTTVAADIRDQRTLGAAFREMRLAERNLVGVVANAGVGGENTYGKNDRWNEILETNLTGTYRLIQEALPALKASPTPFKNIAIVSSVLAHLGVPGYSAYCASKAGLLGLTRSLAAELAPQKILVNAICPGWVDTTMSDDGLEAMAVAMGKTPAQVRSDEMAKVPLRKMSDPVEIGKLIRFLISNEQSSITGQTLNINNGAWM